MHHLRKKGWSKEDIDRLDRAKLQALEKRRPLSRFLDSYLFWVVVILAVVTNMLVGILFVPLLLVLNSFRMYFVIVCFGVCFGLLFENLLSNFGELSHHHYLLLIGMVPAIAAVSILVFAEIANQAILFFGLPNIVHESLLIALVYGLSFMLPFALKHSQKK